jgi:hypothetical protein
LPFQQIIIKERSSQSDDLLAVHLQSIDAAAYRDFYANAASSFPSATSYWRHLKETAPPSLAPQWAAAKFVCLTETPLMSLALVTWANCSVDSRMTYSNASRSRLLHL